MTAESRFEPIFSSPACAAHLAARMRREAAAPCWSFVVDWSPFEAEAIEDVAVPAPDSAWQVAWPTVRAATASVRLRPPPAQLDALVAWLGQMQQAHVDAVGGPIDGARYHIDVYPTQTRVAVSF